MTTTMIVTNRSGAFSVATHLGFDFIIPSLFKRDDFLIRGITSHDDLFWLIVCFQNDDKQAPTNRTL